MARGLFNGFLKLIGRKPRPKPGMALPGWTARR